MSDFTWNFMCKDCNDSRKVLITISRSKGNSNSKSIEKVVDKFRDEDKISRSLFSFEMIEASTRAFFLFILGRFLAWFLWNFYSWLLELMNIFKTIIHNDRLLNGKELITIFYLFRFFNGLHLRIHLIILTLSWFLCIVLLVSIWMEMFMFMIISFQMLMNDSAACKNPLNDDESH